MKKIIKMSIGFISILSISGLVIACSDPKVNNDTTNKLNELKSEINKNLNVIVPKGGDYNSSLKIFNVVKKVLELRKGIDASNIKYLGLKINQTVTSVASHGQTATNLIVTINKDEITLKLNQAQFYTDQEQLKIKALKNHLVGNNLNIILPKGVSALYNTDAKILVAIKKAFEKKANIDNSHTVFIKKKLNESDIVSVAAYGQTATNYKITVDGTNFTLKLNQSQHTQINEYVTGLDLDSKIYRNSSAKILNLNSDSSYFRTIYIENENLFIKFSLMNPSFYKIEGSEILKKIIDNDVKEIAFQKTSLGNSFPQLKNDLNNEEKAAIKTQFSKNDNQLNALLNNMKFGVAHIFYIGNKYDENSKDYTAWASSNTSDYIYSNLLAQVSKTSSSEQVKAENDKILALVDLPNYTGNSYFEFNGTERRRPKVKKLVLDTSKTNFFNKVVEWYKKYFPLKSK